jgi:hypothetical protein
MSLMAEAVNQHGQKRAVETDKADRFYGWVFYKHPDGQWVTLRKATPDELAEAERIARHIRILEKLAERVGRT